MSAWWKRPYPIRKNNTFMHDETCKPESLLFGTLPSFVRAMWHRIKNYKTYDTSQFLEKDTIVGVQQGISHNAISITWIGHATFLIRCGDVTLLTDPIFGSPSLFFPRVIRPGITLEQLPPIDVVLISHNHPDHMDAASLIALKKLNPHMHMLVPWGDKRWFDRRGFNSVHEHSWWESHTYATQKACELSEQVTCTFVPSRHWSQRGLFDKNKSLWGSWMISCHGQKIYFAGDTAYDEHFTVIAQEFSEISTALLPVGPCEPREWMKHSHMDAHDACQALLDLNAYQLVPMHWGTFGFGNDHVMLPIERLQMAWHQKQELTSRQLRILKIGQSIKQEANCI